MGREDHRNLRVGVKKPDTCPNGHTNECSVVTEEFVVSQLRKLPPADPEPRFLGSQTVETIDGRIVTAELYAIPSGNGWGGGSKPGRTYFRWVIGRAESPTFRTVRAAIGWLRSRQ